ncbi:MAG TPA: hypothetical protein VFO70_05690, partial [Chitinophagaceae bacterium]|nr:hypothetical protein [Chitinophagaceae bacterium]
MVRFLFIIVFAVLMVTGCAPARMSVSNELKVNNDEYIVKGKNGTRIIQKISFGYYYTTNIHRSWIKGNGYRNGIGYRGTDTQEWVNIISTEYINKKQTIRFSLTNGKEISDVYCVARFNSRDLQIGKNPNSLLNIGMDITGIGDRLSNTYYVQIFTGEKDERPWEMMIDNQMSQAKPGEYIGWLAKSRTEY